MSPGNYQSQRSSDQWMELIIQCRQRLCTYLQRYGSFPSFSRDRCPGEDDVLADISRVERIYIVCGYTDMRKSTDGLCAVIQEQLKMDSEQNALFLFCGRRSDRIKALLKEPDGFVLIYKRLFRIV